MFSVMIVEDDAVIAAALEEELKKWNYEAFQVTDFNQVLETFLEKQPQMVLMDIQLPSFNGYYWCQEIRKVSNVPIIFITSRTDDMDLVMAIQMGADDFIQKPFHLSVVMAKIQAMLRRTYDFTESDHFLTVDQVVLKPSESTLSYNGQSVDVTKNETKIMEILFRKKGEFVSREELMTRLWEDESFIDDNTLAVNIARLRKKLKQIGREEFIKTKKGVGYAVGREE
ncbi:response regulator transcription factor [Atopococcus tabaci]|uniref:response regulator transcription factor n=1 Tax=Atopococcus tabaci TaxID=269774 RepID=UPI002409169D|nr:response regulator transcription factor [Atopococcus tabaci]